MNHGIKTRNLVLCALMTALTAVCAQIQLPIGPVPISLATLCVMIAGGLLGPRYGALSQIVYLLLGAVNIPVFAGFSAGLSRLVGPTGGYLIGYVAGAWLIGMLTRGEKQSNARLILSMLAGNVLLLTVGTAYFMLVTKNGPAAALSMCVLPFLPGDAAKIIVASLTVKRLKKWRIGSGA